MAVGNKLFSGSIENSNQSQVVEGNAQDFVIISKPKDELDAVIFHASDAESTNPENNHGENCGGGHSPDGININVGQLDLNNTILGSALHNSFEGGRVATNGQTMNVNIGDISNVLTLNPSLHLPGFTSPIIKAK